MKEIGIDISNQRSEVIDTEFLNHSTLAVTLCDDVEKRCPLTPSHVKRMHWGFQDPAKAIGTEAEVWKVFQHVRDEIAERIKQFEEIGE